MNTSTDVYPVFKGSTHYLSGDFTPQITDVTNDLIERAMNSPEDDPIYVVAIGAITNIANALLIEPNIIEKIVMVWLGGNFQNESERQQLLFPLCWR